MEALHVYRSGSRHWQCICGHSYGVGGWAAETGVYCSGLVWPFRGPKVNPEWLLEYVRMILSVRDVFTSFWNPSFEQFPSKEDKPEFHCHNYYAGILSCWEPNHRFEAVDRNTGTCTSWDIWSIWKKGYSFHPAVTSFSPPVFHPHSSNHPLGSLGRH